MANLHQPAGYNFCSAVGEILDEMAPRLASRLRISLGEVADRVFSAFGDIRSEWFTGELPDINYQDSLSRLAYLYMFVPAFADICQTAIEASGVRSSLTALINRDEVIRVAAFGGGPGTELMALAKILLTPLGQCQPAVLTFTLVDRVSEWHDSLNRVVNTIRKQMREDYGVPQNWPLSISHQPALLDVLNPGPLDNHAALLEHDVYLLNHFVSEIHHGYQDSFPVFVEMAQQAPNGADFLIIDRQEPHVVSAAEELLAVGGLRIVGRDTVSNALLSGDEQISDMGAFGKLCLQRGMKAKRRLKYMWIHAVK